MSSVRRTSGTPTKYLDLVDWHNLDILLQEFKPQEAMHEVARKLGREGVKTEGAGGSTTAF